MDGEQLNQIKLFKKFLSDIDLVMGFYTSHSDSFADLCDDYPGISRNTPIRVNAEYISEDLKDGEDVFIAKGSNPNSFLVRYNHPEGFIVVAFNVIVYNTKSVRALIGSDQRSIYKNVHFVSEKARSGIVYADDELKSLSTSMYTKIDDLLRKTNIRIFKPHLESLIFGTNTSDGEYKCIDGSNQHSFVIAHRDSDGVHIVCKNVVFFECSPFDYGSVSSVTIRNCEFHRVQGGNINE